MMSFRDVDVPKLASSGIRLGAGCFANVLSVQSSGILSPIILSIDADSLQLAIKSKRLSQRGMLYYFCVSYHTCIIPCFIFYPDKIPICLQSK